MGSLSQHDLLIQLEQKLMEDLAQVRRMLGKEPQMESQPEKAEKHAVKAIGIPKGKGVSWESYVQTVIDQLGGKSKTRGVYEYAIRANPKLDPDTVLDAVRGKLSKLYRSGTIGATESEIKSEGYEYFTKK